MGLIHLKVNRMKVAPLVKPLEQSSSGLNYEELWEFFPEFFDHVSDVLLSDTKECFKGYIRTVLEHLENWDHITWKQFKGVLKIHSVYENFLRHKSGDLFTFNFSSGRMIFDKRNSIFSDSSLTTEEELDMMSMSIFGNVPMYEEEELGYERSYSNGKRVFLLPVGM